ncbi:UNVERIFIED_CONTAM: hypothetical protein HDU68_008097 [Siphonaria sp. JEL0065]|nr:hypothetical protein HDU68_008097 [Siphonaria sp. JEL0065]
MTHFTVFDMTAERTPPLFEHLQTTARLSMARNIGVSTAGLVVHGNSVSTGHPLASLCLASGFSCFSSEKEKEKDGIDVFLANALGSMGASDILLLTAKLVVHVALGWRSNKALLLEGEGLFRVLATATNLYPNNSYNHYNYPNNNQTHSRKRSASSASVGSSAATATASSSNPASSASTPLPPSHHPHSNYTAVASPYLLFSNIELAELAGTSLDSLNCPPLFAYHHAILPHLQTLQHTFAIQFNSPLANGPIPPPEHSSTRPHCDLSLITNFIAFRVCLSHVLRYAVRVIPPASQQNETQQSSALPWSVLGGVVGNWHSTVGSGWKRRLGPGGFEICGPRGGGCGLYGWEEVLGRLFDHHLIHQDLRLRTLEYHSRLRTVSSSSNSHVHNGDHSPNAATATPLTATTTSAITPTLSPLATPTNHVFQFSHQFYKSHPEVEMEDLECRNAWIKRSPLSTSGFLVIMPLIDTLDRRTRLHDVEVEEEVRSRRLGHAQRMEYVSMRSDVRVEYTPSAVYLCPTNGEDAIRLENEDDLSVQTAPEGYTLQHYPAMFHIYPNTNYLFQRQKLAMSSGNLPNHHLLLSYGIVEDKNVCDVIDIPIDLIEDAITCHLEYFGPTMRPIIMNPNSSSSAVNFTFDLKARYRTANERMEALRGKGKTLARYDVCTYERARSLLKGMGLFPREGGIIRCRAEYFWQEDVFSTIIQVLLMSSEQLTEYSLEPCFLDYSSMIASPTISSDSPKASPKTPINGTAPLRDIPPPRPNMIPSYKARNRGPLPVREGALDAFLAVSCGILRRRLQMYPTTFMEDMQLITRMNEAFSVWKDQQARAAQTAVGVASKIGTTPVHPAVIPVSSVAPTVDAKGVGEEGEDEEHEEKRRRREGGRGGGGDTHAGNDCNISVSSIGSDNSSGQSPELETVEKLKSTRSDDTLVSETSYMSSAQESEHQQQQYVDTNMAEAIEPERRSVPHISISNKTFTSATLNSQLHAPSNQQNPQQQPLLPPPPPTLELYTPNRMLAVRYRVAEKRNLQNALAFLETIVKNQHGLVANNNNNNSNNNRNSITPANTATINLPSATAVAAAAIAAQDALKRAAAIPLQQHQQAMHVLDDMEELEEYFSDEFSDMADMDSNFSGYGDEYL